MSPRRENVSVENLFCILPNDFLDLFVGYTEASSAAFSVIKLRHWDIIGQSPGHLHMTTVSALVLTTARLPVSSLSNYRR